MILNSLDIMKSEPFTDEVDSFKTTSKTQKNGNPKTEQNPPPPANDGEIIELGKRPRGRPPGSKNRPKPPVVITKDPEPTAAMRPYVLEIPAGHDIADCLARFSRRRNLGISVLAATGAAANVTIRQPGSEQAIAFHGRFEILSISATFLPPAMAAPPPPAAATTITLAGPQGQVIGGVVVGPLLAAGIVMVVAAAFGNASFHLLPVEEELSVSVSVSGNETAQTQYNDEDQQRFFNHFHLQQTRSPSPPPPPPPPAAAESGGMGIYGSQFSQEMIWPPGGRTMHRPY